MDEEEDVVGGERGKVETGCTKDDATKARADGMAAMANAAEAVNDESKKADSFMLWPDGWMTSG